MTECRVFGHAWDQIPTHERPRRGEAIILLRCTRCAKERKDIVSAFAGVLLSRSYVEPVGWVKMPKQSMAEKRLDLLGSQRKRRRSA